MIEAGVKTGLGDKWVKVGPLKTAIDVRFLNVPRDCQCLISEVMVTRVC